MYAVFSRRSIIYIGEDQQAAVDLMAEKGNEECSMVMPTTLPALQREFEKYLESHTENGVDSQAQSAHDEAVEAYNHLMDLLEEANITPENINALLDRAKENTGAFVSDVKRVGRTGLNKLGNCLASLGELLQETEAPNEPPVSKPSQDDDEEAAHGGRS